ncbi:TetR/AcrR family transcriptional regulator [Herbiconiux sp.]|uniref:TetR/AcrR family transcriptional regulator n=1 Tax=Herbiconiux sp. TaxID=1871186 RepID=UPI0025BD5173|nr:TetR/AcrR family transcriptional regulator [Herbiconiux sp.]
MAWDVEGTKRALLTAAVAEFSEKGFGGARIDRISERAGVNRERLYSYFGNKRQLFEAVLADQLGTILDGVPVTETGPAAAAGFAGRYFDACRSHPELPRLVFWEGLELTYPIDTDTRTARAALKSAELGAAVGELSGRDAASLLLTIVSLCHSWFASPNLGLIITGDDGDHEGRRRIVTATTEALTRGLLEGPAGG